MQVNDCIPSNVTILPTRRLPGLLIQLRGRRSANGSVSKHSISRLVNSPPRFPPYTQFPTKTLKESDGLPL